MLSGSTKRNVCSVLFLPVKKKETSCVHVMRPKSKKQVSCRWISLVCVVITHLLNAPPQMYDKRLIIIANTVLYDQVNSLSALIYLKKKI